MPTFARAPYSLQLVPFLKHFIPLIPKIGGSTHRQVQGNAWGDSGLLQLLLLLLWLPWRKEIDLASLLRKEEQMQLIMKNVQ